MIGDVFEITPARDMGYDWPALGAYAHNRTLPGRKPVTRAEKRKRREKKQHKRRIRKLRGSR